MSNPFELISITQVANELKTSYTTVSKWATEGKPLRGEMFKLATVREGRKILTCRAWVAAFILSTPQNTKDARYWEWMKWIANVVDDQIG